MPMRARQMNDTENTEGLIRDLVRRLDLDAPGVRGGIPWHAPASSRY
jgi:hypothetical protein